jgi:hypothetical protein
VWDARQYAKELGYQRFDEPQGQPQMLSEISRSIDFLVCRLEVRNGSGESGCHGQEQCFPEGCRFEDARPQTTSDKTNVIVAQECGLNVAIHCGPDFDA